MPRTGLSQEELREAALDAAEKTIRKFGFEKTRLVDIAKEINVSHPVLYRLFPDKIALMDAVSDRWLLRIDDQLEKIVAKKGSAKTKLGNWFLTLHHLKREKVSMDPELFKAFNSAAERKRPIVERHLKTSIEQLRSIVHDGINSGEFKSKDAKGIADLFYHGTMSFHHPKLVADNLKTDRVPLLKKILATLMKGIS